MLTPSQIASSDFKGNDKMDKYKEIRFGSVTGCSGRGVIYIPCLMYDSLLCQIDVEKTNN